MNQTPSNPTPPSSLSLILLLILLLSSPAPQSAAQSDFSLGRKRSTIERMRPERLDGATREARLHGSRRKDLPPHPGLIDFRATFHAHAEDSAHTGGTRPEMLADAKKVGLDVVFLSDHFRPPKDFITETWRGLHEGVLFIPGSETHGFLIHPTSSIMETMDKSGPEIIEAVTANGGLIFLSHVEERTDHSMAGLTGMEIYNRHADANDDRASLIAIMQMVTDPESLAVLEDSLEKYPDAILATQLDYPQVYFDKWDMETQNQRVVGVAANDCHHNQVFIVKMVDENSVRIGTIVDDDDEMRIITADQRPGIREMTKGRKPGDVLASLDFDPYDHSFGTVSTHIFAPELTEEAIRAAVAAGHVYVSHDWMCNPTGFKFFIKRNDHHDDRPLAIMGDEFKASSARLLVVNFPVRCWMRLLKDGEEIHAEYGDRLIMEAAEPGVYRVEGWLDVDAERRPWIYSNPIYLR